MYPFIRKKDKMCCHNYRGISLPSHGEKLLASVILHRVKKIRFSVRHKPVLEQTEA